MAFPTLSRAHLPIEITPEDNTIRSPFEAGYEHRRPRFTRTRRFLKVSYDMLSTADKDLLVAHFDSVGTHTNFTFTDIDSNNYNVYYDKPIKYSKFVTGWYKFDTIELVEV